MSGCGYFILDRSWSESTSLPAIGQQRVLIGRRHTTTGVSAFDKTLSVGC